MCPLAVKTLRAMRADEVSFLATLQIDSEIAFRDSTKGILGRQRKKVPPIFIRGRKFFNSSLKWSLPCHVTSTRLKIKGSFVSF